MNIPIAQHPAFLWVGPYATTKTNCIYALQKALCPDNACTQCAACNAIEQRQSSSLLWIEPEKNYKRDELDAVFAAVQFQRSADDPFFIVLANADTMNSTCANSLLKVVEEPPTGYHFILLAESAESVLPTIRSRCLLYATDSANANGLHPFVHLCMSMDAKKYIEIHDLLENDLMSEAHAEQIVGVLMHQLKERYAHAIMSNNTHQAVAFGNKFEQLCALIEKPIMPGSTKIFLRTVALKMLE